MRIVQYLKWMRRREGGVVNTCMLLCPMLAREGHRVTLLTCDDDDVPADAFDKRGLHSTEVAAHSGRPMCVRLAMRDRLAELRGKKAEDAERDLPFQVLTKAALECAALHIKQADVLHLHGPWATSNAQLARLARTLGVGYVVSPHGMLDDWCLARGALKKKLHLAVMGRPMLNRARCVHFEGQEEGRQGRVHTSAPIAIGPPPPIDPRPFVSLPTPEIARETFAPLREGIPSVVFLSRLTPKKGPDVLIDAAAKWKAMGCACNVLLGGTGDPPEYEQALRAQVCSLGVEDRVHFLGLVTGELKWSLLRAATLVVLPTHQENWGIVLLEALAVGTPIITTKAVDTWPEFESSGGAVIIPKVTQGGGQALVDAVASCVREPSKLRAMGEAGRVWALTNEEPGALARWYARMLAGETIEQR
jgi:glycosyltransferase involved in cell wall biosynthesis